MNSLWSAGDQVPLSPTNGGCNYIPCHRFLGRGQDHGRSWRGLAHSMQRNCFGRWKVTGPARSVTLKTVGKMEATRLYKGV